MAIRSLTALPVYNEAKHVNPVLDEVRQYSSEILVVDDGSADGTHQLLEARNDIAVVAHPQNRGYGAALQSAFRYAIEQQYDVLVTIDCDGQHEPCRIPRFVDAARSADIVSGSRYLKKYSGDSEPPPQRLYINRQITSELNRCLGLELTDAFCGFKAYRVEALKRLNITEDGYGMPLELWIKAVAAGLHIIELPVPLIYLEEERSFGGSLDNGATRLQYYHAVMERAFLATGLSGGTSCWTPCGENAG
jgi:glycosyltransferase involved in cell wall biosynthesis